MKFRNVLLWIFFGLMIVFVLIYTIGYTLDGRYQTNSVRLLTLSRVTLLIVATIYLCTVRQNLPHLLDALSVTAGCIIVVGALSGLLNQGDWPSYLRHGFQYACLVAFYLVGRDLACREIPKAVFAAIFITILAGYTVAAILYAATPGLQNGSYSYQPNLALLPLAYNGSAIMSAASAVLIIVGNKRAVFLGACLCVGVLIVLFVAKRRGGLSLPFRTISTFAVTLAISVALVLVLSTVQIPLLGTVATRISSSPSHINPETNAGMADSVSNSPDARKQRIEEIARLEATIDLMVRWTGARNIEIEAISRLLNERPIATLIGAGFGSTYEMEYISPNNYKRVSYRRDQADVLPAHIAMTSGWPLAILFTAIFVVVLWRMFANLDGLPQMDRTFLLFSISLFIDIMLGFNSTNALIWCSIGYATMRSRNAGAMV